MCMMKLVPFWSANPKQVQVDPMGKCMSLEPLLHQCGQLQLTKTVAQAHLPLLLAVVCKAPAAKCSQGNTDNCCSMSVWCVVLPGGEPCFLIAEERACQFSYVTI